jgi:hypothetical protein
MMLFFMDALQCRHPPLLLHILCFLHMYICTIVHMYCCTYVKLYICPICVPGPYKVAQESEALVNYVRTLMRPPPPAEASLVLREIS